MKKFYESTRCFAPFLNPHPAHRLTGLCFSTEALVSTSPSPDSLFKRISPITDPKASISPVLDQWIQEGNSVTHESLVGLIHKMKGFKRFQHALEISHWMTGQRYFPLTQVDVAVRLNLIYEVHGIERVEKYFDNTSKQLKSHQVYNTLMNCYVKEKSVHKAEAVMQELKKLGFVTSFSYNVLIILYTKIGQHEKILILMKEMEKNGIPWNKYTLNNLLNAYVVVSDIGGMEQILDRMEANTYIFVEWTAYALAASGYIKVGVIDKALALLKKIEKMTQNTRTMKVLNYLLTLYANAGLKDDVYRVWEFCMAEGRVQNSSYCCMISSLVKMDEIVGAEEIFRKWESSGTSYDFRVLNCLISGYSRKGLSEKAEALVKEAVEKTAESGSAPYAVTWKILALGYLKEKNMPKVVEMSKKELSVGRQSWNPSPIIVDSCLEYFDEQGDVEGAEEFIKLLKRFGPLTREVYHRILRIYIAATKPVLDVLDWMKADGLSADADTEKILQRRPVSIGT